MATTLEELKEKLVEVVDETLLLEILNITSSDLVERFEDKIDDQFDRLVADLFPEEENTQSEI